LHFAAQSLTDDAVTSCFFGSASSFVGVRSNIDYWSSTSGEISSSRAWHAFLGGYFAGTPAVIDDPKSLTVLTLWPVRGGSR
jgi:hypothetical protein